MYKIIKKLYVIISISCTILSTSPAICVAEALAPSNTNSTPDIDFTMELLDSPALVLVNKDNRIPDDYDAQLVSICNNRTKASSLIINDLEELLNAAREADHNLYITSAYRSIDYQQGLIDKDVTKYVNEGLSPKKALKKTYDYLMPAGYSEHHTGLALDILCGNNYQLDNSQADEPANKWLRKNCQKYGFILRYPKGKEEITGIKYEPWHFRYVGRDVAEYIMNNKIVLEEFIEEVTTIDESSDNNTEKKNDMTIEHSTRYAPMANQCLNVQQETPSNPMNGLNMNPLYNRHPFDNTFLLCIYRSLWVLPQTSVFCNFSTLECQC